LVLLHALFVVELPLRHFSSALSDNFSAISGLHAALIHEHDDVASKSNRCRAAVSAKVDGRRRGR
jgi:hypothetical protein